MIVTSCTSWRTWRCAQPGDPHLDVRKHRAQQLLTGVILDQQIVLLDVQSRPSSYPP